MVVSPPAFLPAGSILGPKGNHRYPVLPRAYRDVAATRLAGRDGGGRPDGLGSCQSVRTLDGSRGAGEVRDAAGPSPAGSRLDRKSTRLNSSHVKISYAVFCLI